MRLDEPLFDRREHSLQVYEQLVVDQARMDVARTTAHIFLLEPRNDIADGGLDLSL